MNPIKIIILFLFIFICGCSVPEPSTDELRKIFEKNQVTFEDLKKMITSDAKERGSDFTIGVKSIGDWNEHKYCKVFGSVWKSCNNGSILSFNDVLKAVSMSPERYAKYVKLLKTIGAKKVDHFMGDKYYKGENICILMHRKKGSDCDQIIEINFGEDIPESYGKKDQKLFQETTLLSNGWYINIECI